MAKDFKSYIEKLKAVAPDEIIEIKREVDPRYEATTLLRKLELEGKYPLVLFHGAKNLKGGKAQVSLAFNAFASRKKLAVALDLPPEQYKMELALELAKRYRNPIAPLVIPYHEAPVKEVVQKGSELNLLDYPIPIHHSLDGGPYILGGSTVLKDPETGTYNLAMLRYHIKDGQKATIHAEPHHHSGMIVKSYNDIGKEAPFAIVIGHHPSYYLGSQWEGPYGRNEYEIAGAAMAEPVRLVPSETWGDDFLVPADAEMIIEGVVLPGEKDEEGPIGEHTRYYKTIRNGKIEKRYDPVVKFTAITRRQDGYFLSCFLGHPDQALIGSIPKEAVIYEKAKGCCPGIKAVHLTPAAVARYICYVSLKQRVAGEAKDAIMAAFISDWHIKFAVAVDEDIDIFSDQEVLWAVATRTQPDKGFFVIPGCMGSPLDPTVSLDSMKPLTSKMGIDATKPYGEPFSEVCEVPLDLLEKIKLEDYLGK
ncbi:MAG TPA: UbiD family decarboxylase [Desulfosporosinus sp.]|nr:UbiD family decarboxylase [Desulfosporosinus sp.]